MLFNASDVDLANRIIVIDTDTNNVNGRDAHDSLYPTPVSGDEVTFRVIAGVIVGSDNATLPAFDVGDWPSGVLLFLEVLGRIQGKGGDGASAAGDYNGGSGGTALYTRFAIDVTATGGEIWGGGGGGGAHSVGLGGGGGAGQLPGIGGNGISGPTTGSPGTTEAGGAGAEVPPFFAGDGGGPG